MLELRVENGCVDHSRSMGVVSNNYGGFGGGRDGGWYACETKPGGAGHMSRDAGTIPKCEVKTRITPHSRCATLGRFEPELVGLQRKALT